MYQILLCLHSVIRWLILGGLLCSIYRAYKGYWHQQPFTPTDNALRHWTATLAHVQLMLGIILYSQSIVVKACFKGLYNTGKVTEPVFFGLIHIGLMLIAIIIITISSAMAKRKSTDNEKFKTMLWGFVLALIILFIAIPWPFSPLVQRPYIRLY